MPNPIPNIPSADIDRDTKEAAARGLDREALREGAEEYRRGREADEEGHARKAAASEKSGEDKRDEGDEGAEEETSRDEGRSQR